MENDSKAAKALQVLTRELDSRILSFLNSCVRCGLCAETCHVYLSDGEDASIPASKIERLARFFRRYRTLLGRILPFFTGAESIDDSTLEALKEASFGRCTACGRCALSCPMGLDPSAVIMFARAMLVAAGMVPKGINNNIEAAVSTGNSMSIPREEVIETVQWLGEDLRMTVGNDLLEMPVDRKGARILYALNPRELKFFPLSISAAALIFHAAGESWTLSSTNFDITNYGYFASDLDGAARIGQALAEKAEELEVRELVLAECGHGFNSNRWESPEWLGRPSPAPVRSFIELLVEYIAGGRIKLDPTKNPRPVTLHDPCNLVRRGGIIEEQRYVLRRAVQTFIEMHPNREHNYCCGGGGGLLAASEYSDKRIQSGRIKAEQIKATGAKIVVTPCHNCIDQLLELNKHYKLGAEFPTLGEIVAEALVIPRGGA